MTKDPRAAHLAAVDAVNDAKTEAEHRQADAYLRGWRDGARASGGVPGLMDADWHTGARYGFPDLQDGCPPVCCGVRLDWTPEGYPTHGAVVSP